MPSLRSILPAVLAAPFLAATSYATPPVAWRPLGAEHASTSPMAPSSSRIYAVDAGAWSSVLATLDSDPEARVQISLPLPDGRVVPFTARRGRLFGERFAWAHPELRVYRAVGTDDPALEARLDVTMLGLHAMILTPEGAALIDRVTPGATDAVRAYWARDAAAEPFACTVADMTTTLSDPGRPHVTALGDQLKTFTFILIATGEYTQAVGSEPAALAQMTTSMNRIDGVFEREATTHLEVTNLMAFPDPATDPFLPTGVLNRLAVVTDSIFGAGTYDMTQCISVRPGYSGGAFRPLFCFEGWTGQSEVSGVNPFSDQFHKVMEHEIGHTLGATHSQDGGNNRAAVTAYEPALGWTIMTSPGDPASFGDAFFHGASIEQMATTLSTGDPGSPGPPDCESLTPTGNTPPTVEAGPDFTIPCSTPFVLTGSGSDPDVGDVLTYTWDEMDRAAATNDSVNGPRFRWRPPTSSPSRSFPALSTVLSGVLDPLEKLPNGNRILKFRLVARDNHAGGGGVAWDSMQVSVTDAPFAVTFPNGGESLQAGTSFGVTWAVGGGSVASTVDVMLSTNGGSSWIPLAMGTPNDGAQSVLFTTATTRPDCRIRVSAVGNVFYDVSNSSFTLLGDVTAVGDPVPSPSLDITAVAPNPTSGTMVIHYSLPDGGPARLRVLDVQGRVAATLFDGVGEPGTHYATWDASRIADRSPGLYFVCVESRGARSVRRVAVVR